ncbi:hypothetical protein E1B28_006336 [Marasmius oreades]|uniref:SAP domain-containing protein n=1 Tax=Marasmius oreades TaxID=181124 RepID=A0A9P7S5E1_9AGAR|nr:uncharacterized protein E1B28_006336 [Marasmius oreades]KAG7095610.1 hypothetical protein E1B28_006336 [Marasmius oreades]
MSATTTTTEILFNSPALHSLKRDQLVKLCKIHSIKASGKNVELIARLKAVAETLPKDSALSIAARSEEKFDDVDEEGDQKMEVAELGGSSSQGTLASHRSGEFGTTSSKASMSTSTSVSSSIKALASSLGLKRNFTTKSTASTVSSTSSLPPLPVFPKPYNYPANDDLSKYAKPYSAIPESSPSSLPKQDNFPPDNVPTAASLVKFDFANRAEPEPLPGHTLRPGAPAPSDARLSLGQTPATPGGKRKSGATTTIRLISNSTAGEDGFPSSFKSIAGPATPQLKPFKPSFDLVLGSPSVPGQTERIYPALPMGDILYNRPTTPTQEAEAKDDPSRSVPGGLPALSPSANGNSNDPRFIFGSPDPRKRPSVTNDEFRTTASSVLYEVNKRLQREGIDTIDGNIMNAFEPGGKLNEDGSPRVVKPLPRPRGAVKDKFDRMHEKEFKKMEGIGGFMKRKAAAPTISTEVAVAGRKRKSSVLGPDRGEIQNAANKKSKARATVPGGFGDEEEDEDEDERAGGKKPRVEFAEEDDGVKAKAREEEQERLRREREVIRRKLAMNREKRRSSGRPSFRASTGPRRSTLRLQKVPPKPAPASKSRFGFGFVSRAATTLVRGVWGGGSSKNHKEKEKEKEKPNSPTEVAVSTSTTSTSTPNGITPKPHAKPSVSGASGSMGPPLVPNKTGNGHQRKPSSSSALNAPGTGPGSTTAMSRSPIPANLRNGNGSGSNSDSGSSRNSVADASLRSVRGSISTVQAGSSASASTRSRTSASTTNFLPTTFGSRLLAPTASSLAKAQGSVNRLRQVGPVPQNKPTSQGVTSLSSKDQGRTKIFDSITNTNTNSEGVIASKLAALPSTPGKIFSRPLVVPPGSGIPSPVRSGSMTTTTTGRAVSGPTRQKSLMGRKPRISRSKVIARLASQRVASSSSGSSVSPTSGTANPGQSATTTGSVARSSLGPRIGGAGPRKSVGVRRSHVGAGGGIGRREARESAVMMSAKKRVRQSEYARRRSRVSTAGQRMEVDT